jgi:hypothetical protein
MPGIKDIISSRRTERISIPYKLANVSCLAPIYSHKAIENSFGELEHIVDELMCQG